MWLSGGANIFSDGSADCFLTLLKYRKKKYSSNPSSENIVFLLRRYILIKLLIPSKFPSYRSKKSIDARNANTRTNICSKWFSSCTAAVRLSKSLQWNLHANTSKYQLKIWVFIVQLNGYDVRIMSHDGIMLYNMSNSVCKHQPQISINLHFNKFSSNSQKPCNKTKSRIMRLMNYTFQFIKSFFCWPRHIDCIIYWTGAKYKWRVVVLT